MMSASTTNIAQPRTRRPGVSGVRSFSGGIGRPARKNTIIAHMGVSVIFNGTTNTPAQSLPIA